MDSPFLPRAALTFADTWKKYGADVRYYSRFLLEMQPFFPDILWKYPLKTGGNPVDSLWKSCGNLHAYRIHFQRTPPFRRKTEGIGSIFPISFTAWKKPRCTTEAKPGDSPTVPWHSSGKRVSSPWKSPVRFPESPGKGQRGRTKNLSIFFIFFKSFQIRYLLAR